MKEGRAAYFGDAAGFYIADGGGPRTDVHEFAANLADPDESRSRPKRR